MPSHLSVPFAEEIAEHRATLLESVFRHSPIGKALVAPDGTFIAVNPALSRMLGLTEEHLRRVTLHDLTHPDDQAADQQLLRELSVGLREHYSVTKRYVHSGGQCVWAQVDVSMVAAAHGRPAFYIAQIQDVTARIEREREFQDLLERFNLALEATEDGLWDWQMDQARFTVSDAWRRLTGHSPTGQNLSWRHWLRAVHPEDRPQLWAHLRGHLRGDRPRIEISYRHLRPAGGWRWLALRGRITQRDQTGQPSRITGTLRDIDERVRAQQDLQVLMDHLPAKIGYWDRHLRNRFGNRTYFDWFGQDARSLPGRHISEVLDARTYALDRPMMNLALQGEEQVFERVITDPGGVRRHTRVHYVPDRRGDEIIGFFALGIDLTDLRDTERALAEQQEQARVTLRSIGDSVVTTDRQGLIDFLNPAAERMTGWSTGEALGQPIERVMPLLDDETGQVMLNPLRVALQEQAVQGMAPGAVLVARNGSCACVEDSAAPIIADDGALLGGVIVFHDVTEKRALAARMAHLAQHDPLTGLPNRTLVLSRTQQLTRLNRRHHGAFSLAFLDLDGFKTVNDTLGHSAGDDLLRQVALRLRGQLREADTVSRVGGDEFVLLLPETASMAEAEIVLNRVLTATEQPFMLGQDEVRVTASCGAALFPQDGATVEDLVRHADLAMYRAKAEGRNRLCFFNEQLETDQRERHRLSQAIRQAVALEDFELAYQPKVNGVTGELTGVEALLRWTHQGVAVAPTVFVPFAEEAGHMPALGTWVLRAACLQGRAWLDTGHPVRIAVNVSAVQFREPTFFDTVRDVLHWTGLPANLLELEVTEGVLMQEVQRVRTILRALQELGVHISIDDFGTGYSSLSYLHTLPLNTLKIDRSFVHEAAENTRRQALLSGIITLGQSLDLGLIAEGVETEVERAYLLTSGCEQMQGYLFSPPVPAQAITAWLSRS